MGKVGLALDELRVIGLTIVLHCWRWDGMGKSGIG